MYVDDDSILCLFKCYYYLIQSGKISMEEEPYRPYLFYFTDHDFYVLVTLLLVPDPGFDVPQKAVDQNKSFDVQNIAIELVGVRCRNLPDPF